MLSLGPIHTHTNIHIQKMVRIQFSKYGTYAMLNVVYTYSEYGAYAILNVVYIVLNMMHMQYRMSCMHNTEYDAYAISNVVYT